MPKKWWLFRVQGVLVILAVCAVTTPALAHRVLVYAYTEGGTIHTERPSASSARPTPS